MSIERRAPSRFIEGIEEAYHAPTVEEHYRRQYYSTIATIEKRFDQPDYAMHYNLEGLLFKAARLLCRISSSNGDDLQTSSLSAQLTTFR